MTWKLQNWLKIPGCCKNSTWLFFSSPNCLFPLKTHNNSHVPPLGVKMISTCWHSNWASRLKMTSKCFGQIWLCHLLVVTSLRCFSVWQSARVCVHGSLDGAPPSPTLYHPQGCSYWLLLWCVWCIIGPNVWGGGPLHPSVIKGSSCEMGLAHSYKMLRQML